MPNVPYALKLEELEYNIFAPLEYIISIGGGAIVATMVLGRLKR
jgi:hypothetical protein